MESSETFFINLCYSVFYVNTHYINPCKNIYAVKNSNLRTDISIESVRQYGPSHLPSEKLYVQMPRSITLYKRKMDVWISLDSDITNITNLYFEYTL